MNDQIKNLVDQIRDLEKQLHTAIDEQQTRVLYEIRGRRVRFEHAVKDAHKSLKIGLFRWLLDSRPRVALSAPFIYGLIVPIVFLDFCLVCYQAICFRLYRIPKVGRSGYIVVDRHQLAYLNIIEKLNCAYCGYAIGVLAYAREIASRTEQYWCPIKHARSLLDTHSRYMVFADYGDAEGYRSNQRELQRALSEEESSGSRD